MRHLSVSLIVVALLTLVMVGMQGFGRADEPAEDDYKAATQWEYCSIATGDAGGLAKLGNEGWEAYAATQVHNAGVRIYLKRVKQ